jgi:catechol 2,3-dioxygenase
MAGSAPGADTGGMTTTPTATLPAAFRLGTAELVVTDLDRSLPFYTQAIGLHLQRREDGVAVLGDGSEDVLVLRAEAGAKRAGRHAGLYHVALLYPSREELARVLQRLVQTHTMIQGASDHMTHEAIYLSDPDGNGLELAADRPREQWPPVEVTYSGGPQPLDIDDLLSVTAGAEPPSQVEPGLRVGHVHLHVGDIGRAIAFYRDVVGLDLIANIGSAAFLSAGGYHHHLGTNVWRGQDVPPFPEGTVGLSVWTALLPTRADVDAVRARAEAAGAPVERESESAVVVRDPWNNALRFATA